MREEYNAAMGSGRPQVCWDERHLASPHEVDDKPQRVREMFDAIADRYELVNHVLSGWRDVAWRKRLWRLLAPGAEDEVLDIAAGTGEVARLFAERQPRPRRVVGVDFAGSMLALAARRSNGLVRYCRGDALRLPFADRSFTICTCAFGLRNFGSFEAGLAEMARVLRPGGRAGILEFDIPRRGPLARAYRWYFMRILPVIAARVSGDRTGAYRYLPRSVLSFLRPEDVVAACRRVGFREVSVSAMTLGAVVFYIAWR